jgi:hypothetical protein
MFDSRGTSVARRIHDDDNDEHGACLSDTRPSSSAATVTPTSERTKDSCQEIQQQGRKRSLEVEDDSDDNSTNDHEKKTRLKALWVKRRFGEEFADKVKNNGEQWTSVPETAIQHNTCFSFYDSNKKNKNRETKFTSETDNYDSAELELKLDEGLEASLDYDDDNDDDNEESKEEDEEKDDDEEGEEKDDDGEGEEEEIKRDDDKQVECNDNTSKVTDIVQTLNDLNGKLVGEYKGLTTKYAKCRFENQDLKKENKMLAEKVAKLEDKLRQAKEWCTTFSASV